MFQPSPPTSARRNEKVNAVTGNIFILQTKERNEGGKVSRVPNPVTSRVTNKLSRMARQISVILFSKCPRLPVPFAAE